MSNGRNSSFDEQIERNERSYFELKVTFVHIVVLLVSVLMIGILLFYLGYRAGYASSQRGPRSEASLATVPPPDTPPAAAAISQEMRLHREEPSTPASEPPAALPAASPQEAPAAVEKPAPAITPVAKPVTSEGRFTIQIGAFSDQKAARKESERFAELGLPIEIIAEVVKGKSYQTVRVGRFLTRGEAEKERNRLERLGNKKFLIKSVRGE